MSSPEKDTLNRNKGISSTHIHDYRGVPTGDYDEDRTEKPWQRVFNRFTKNGRDIHEPVKSVPSTLLVLLLGFYLLLAYLTQLIEDDMPAVVLEASLPRDNADTFSEEVALRYLERIIGDEPRVSGTEYHLNMTQDLKDMLDEIAAQGNQVVRTDWQIASGDYFHNSSASFFNIYRNASNVIALLEGQSGFHENGTIGSSILVNCHYDSVPFALGASDNAVFCAIMAESLAKLSRRRDQLKHNIVFLFNGAEENGLQASHAFLQHPWAKGVTAVINLDAAGMNGKPTIFQVTDPRVLGAYQRTARSPNAQGLAEILFSSGLIPSDTDFRIWRDFGDIHGVDIAFVKWAHVYHTRNDRPDLLQPGVIQCAGDMVLAVLNELADNEEMATRITPTAAVYYDYLNLFLVRYSFAVSYVVDTLIALFGLTSVAYYVYLVGLRATTVYKLLWCALGRVAAVCVGALGACVCVLLMVATTVQMRYLTQPWLVVPVYWLPYTIIAIAFAHAYDRLTIQRFGLTRSIRCLQAMAATRLLLSLVLLILVCIPPLAPLRYLISAPLFIMSAVSLVSLTVIKSIKLKGWQQLVLEVFLCIPSVMFMFSVSLRLDAQMLPIMSRSSTDTPDYTVALLNVGLATIVLATVSGIELLFSSRRLWLVLGGAAIVCTVLMFVPFSPYEDDGLSVQRHYWFHSEIVSHDINNSILSRTSGVMVSKLDPYSTQRVLPTLSSAGVHVDVRRDHTVDCDAQVHCGMPLFRTGFARHLRNAMFIYTGAPTTFDPPVSVNLTERNCANNLCSFSFVFTGANHNMITFWPRQNITISSWSLNSPPQISFYHQQRPVYVLYHSLATYTDQPTRELINVTFNVPDELQSQVIVDLSYHSHKIQHPQDFTTEYITILQAMPRYFNVATFLSFRHNHVF